MVDLFSRLIANEIVDHILRNVLSHKLDSGSVLSKMRKFFEVQSNLNFENHFVGCLDNVYEHYIYNLSYCL